MFELVNICQPFDYHCFYSGCIVFNLTLGCWYLLQCIVMYIDGVKWN